MNEELLAIAASAFWITFIVGGTLVLWQLEYHGPGKEQCGGRR